MFKPRILFSLVLLAVPCAGLACSSSSSGSSNAEVSSACRASCDVAGKGCTTFDVATCKDLCILADYIAASCGPKYLDYVRCQDKEGYDCPSAGSTSSLQFPKNQAVCASKQQAYEKCLQDTAPKCDGSNPDKSCPSVACACPSGTTTSVSGSRSNGSGGCACLTAETCKTSPACR